MEHPVIPFPYQHRQGKDQAADPAKRIREQAHRVLMTDRKRYPVPRDTGKQHASENFDDQSQRLFGLDIFLDQKNRNDRKHDANGQISQMFPAIYFRQGFSPLLNMLSRSIIILMHEAVKHLPFPPHKKILKIF